MSVPPLAYQTNQAEFYGRRFFVTPDVLIPRPETEMAIDAVLNLAGRPILPGVKPGARQLPERPHILDVGTGSGVIAITLKLELPEAEILATDLSKKALQVAQTNATRLGANLNFLQSDLLAFLDPPAPLSQRSDRPTAPFCSADEIPETFDKTPEPFDLIVANLPYVDQTWSWLDCDALSAEPDLALYADDSGLSLIFRLLTEIAEKSALAKDGFLVLEADPCQHERLINRARTLRFTLLETRGFQLVFQFTP
ncbi:methyltransferase domain-containing protein [Candidatus Saccharibacteria bacterium]|nr:methyltransferase domain-containing protein [Candidatus Saccharibacteria bacterium]